MPFPRLVIAGLSGGAGKTQISLGLVRAFTHQGLAVRPFKKGPDYIDTAWLAAAAKGRAFNLDPFFLSEPGCVAQFAWRFGMADLALVEGNRGYFDGMDVNGSASTATLACSLGAPVILVLDCTKMTRTAAALVAGCKNFPGGGRIAGVILNKMARKRHADITRRSIEELSGTPVLGVVPRFESPPIVQRRTGLVIVDEHPNAEEVLDFLGRIMADNVDLERLLELARAAPALPGANGQAVADGAHRLPEAVTTASRSLSSADHADRDRVEHALPPRERPRIGVVRDAALWEYYADNLEALESAGADLVFLKLLRGTGAYEPWPAVHGLYLGGGDLAPYAADLAADAERRLEVRALAASGMPVYAEHAGFFYLAQALDMDGRRYPLAGIFPFVAALRPSPQGLGYVEATVTAETAFYERDSRIRGHEYHYMALHGAETAPHALRRVARGGSCFGPRHDGFVFAGCQGFFMQIFAPAVPGWARRFVEATRRHAALAHSTTNAFGKMDLDTRPPETCCLDYF